LIQALEAGGLAERILVLGATGGFGRAMVHELVRRRLPVRAQGLSASRLEQALGKLEGVEQVTADALQEAQVLSAAEGCAVIVHAVNLPYARWMPDMQTITANVVRTARNHRATILFPGNVYGFGRQTGRPLPEGTEMQPDTRKGAFRIQLEELLKSATSEGEARVIVVRAGDFFGPSVRNGLVDRIFGRARAGKPIQALGRLDVPHEWAYVPDVARLGAELLAIRERLAPFEVVHFAGHVARAQREFFRRVARAAGRPDLPVRTLPWWLLRGLGLADSQLRELIELRYLFDDAVLLDDPRRRELLPDFEPTPIESAIQETLASYAAPGPGSA
jgi:nucleoside-diphosphate-sugar epimerase